jgi:serine/threonine-protein kinase BUR1
MATDPQPSRKSLERLDNGKPRFQGCCRIQEYEYICKLGEGTFGEVSKAKSKRTGQIVALKKILMHNEKDGFPITALREIKLLKQLDHINVLKLEEMAVERPKNASKKTSMFMVTPYMDHDLSGLLENPNVHFTEPQIKCYMKQLLEGCAYLHENRILHRDMKAANLLINNKGILQIADFGLARPYDDEPPKPGQGGGEATRDYTTLVVTRWYRPPELLLQLRRYTTAIDMWGVGCVFGEMFKGKPILAGNSDMHQAQMIFDLVGSPNDQTMPGWSQLPGPDGSPSFIFEQRTSTLRYVFKDQSDLAISLLTELLKLDWRKRINAIDALEHPYFHTPPLPARPGDLPSFEESHELDRRKLRDQKNKPPPAPAGGSVGVGAQGEWGVNGQPIPHNARGAGRGRPYANGHGPPHGRRPPHYGHRDAPHGQYRHPTRDLPPRDQMPFEQSRVPPTSHPPHDPYSRRPPPPPPDTENASTKEWDRHLAIEMTAVVRLQGPEYHQERTSIAACLPNWIGVPHRTWIDDLHLIEAVQETRSSQTTRMLIRTSEYRHMVVVKEIIDEKTWTAHDILRVDETPGISTNLFATMTAHLPHSPRGDEDHETTKSPLDMMIAHRYGDHRGNTMTQHRCGMRIEGGLQAATDRSRPWVQGTTGEEVAVQCEIGTGNGSEAEIGGTGGKTLTHIGIEWLACAMNGILAISSQNAIVSRICML